MASKQVTVGSILQSVLSVLATTDLTGLASSDLHDVVSQHLETWRTERTNHQSSPSVDLDPTQSQTTNRQSPEVIHHHRLLPMFVTLRQNLPIRV